MGSQAFPWVIFSHVLRDRGGQKVFFKHVGRRAKFFNSLGPVKTKREAMVNPTTGTGNGNPVSHVPIVLLSLPSKPCALLSQPFFLHAWLPHSQGPIPGHLQIHKLVTVL